MSIKFSCPLCHTNLTAKDKQSGRSLTCPACGKQIIIPADYYKILRVATNASDTEIDAAYRKLAMRYNPGHNPDDSKAIEKFKLCETAYEILSDPAKRAKYDRTVARDVVDNDKDVSNAKTSPTQSPFKNTFETVVKGTVAEMKDFVEQKVTEYKEEVPTDVGSDSEIIKSNTKRNQWFILGCIVVVIILASATSPGNAFGVIIIGVILGLGFLSYNIVYKNIIETIYLPAYKIINSIVDNPAATRKILIIATICVLPLLATGIVSVAPFITIIRYAKRWKQWQPTLNNAMNVVSQSTAQLSSSASVSSTFDKVKNVIVQSTAQLSSSPSVSSTFDKVKNVIAQSTAQLSSSESVPSTKPMMSDNQRVDHAVTRSGIIIQIVKTRLQSQRCRNFDCDVITNDAYASKNEWLSPGWVITCDETKIYLSLRGQIAKTTPAWKIADWIGDEDINLVTKVSKNDDIIAYPIGTDEELINEILEECNSVPF